MSKAEKVEKTIRNDRRRSNVYILAVIALLTTCFVGSTMARYATVGSAEDEAKVANWGIEITSQGEVFQKEYAKTETTSFANTVISSEKVVAPGTDKTVTDLTVTGTPEVAVQINYDPEIKLEGWDIPAGTNGIVADTEYCPLIFTVEGTDYKIDGTTITSVAELITEVEGAIGDCSAEYPANEAIDVSTDAPSVSWRWEIGTSLDATDETNMKDTALGEMAADGAAPTVYVKITTTVTQID